MTAFPTIKMMAARTFLFLLKSVAKIQTRTAISPAINKCIGPNLNPDNNAESKCPNAPTTAPAPPPNKPPAMMAGKASNATLPTGDGILMPAPTADRAINRASSLSVLTFIAFITCSISISEHFGAADVFNVLKLKPVVDHPCQREKII